MDNFCVRKSLTCLFDFPSLEFGIRFSSFKGFHSKLLVNAVFFFLGLGPLYLEVIRALTICVRNFLV